jgi:hypothetical protein
MIWTNPQHRHPERSEGSKEMSETGTYGDAPLGSFARLRMTLRRGSRKFLMPSLPKLGGLLS